MAVERIRRIDGRGLPVRGDNIDTDRIIPARFLKSITFEGLDHYLFEDDRHAGGQHGAAVHPVSDPRYAGAAVLLVNANFGCGSSREHAPQAIRRWGIRAIVGASFSEIFFGNALALGMPCLTVEAGDARALQDEVASDPGVLLALDLDAMTATAGVLTVKLSLPQAARDAFLEGTWDATGLLLAQFDEVEAVAKRLPYISGWR
jgi:3-isopropylmalate/(R)-2-methylmalate dehydratase small subunit